MNNLFFVLFLLLILFEAPRTRASRHEDMEVAKAHVIEKMEANIREYQKDIDELQASIARNRRQQLLIDPEARLIEYRNKLRSFLEEIKKEEAERVPDFLAAMFISCDRGSCRTGLDSWVVEDSIATFGPLALRPLLDGFQSLASAQKETVLNIVFRVQPPQCPIATLDSALIDPVFRVRAASLVVYKKNCGTEAFYQRLNQLLARETEPELLIYLLDEEPADRALNDLIRLVQAKRIPAEQALGKLCALNLPSLKPDAAELDIPLWLHIFEAQKSRRNCLVENLFLKLDQEKHLVKLNELFHAAAEHRYSFSSIQDPYKSTPPERFSYWNQIPGADAKMLALFQNNLSHETISAWRNAPGTTFGEKLLLTRWLGEDPSTLVPGDLQLQLQVRSPSNAVVSSTIQDVRLDRPFAFTLAPLAPDFHEIRYSGTVRFDADKLNYKIENFIVGLKPAGAILEAAVPITGSFETTLLWRNSPYPWEIRLMSVSR